MNFIRSFWFTIHYCHHRITNRSQNLFGTDLLVDRLEQRRHSGDQKRLLRERYLPYPKQKKEIDSNKLEIGACLKQSKIDIKLPYRWSRLLFFSFLLLPIIPRKPTRHDLGKDNHRATSTRIKRQTMPWQDIWQKTCQAVKLWSCLTTRNTFGRKFRRNTFCVSCSFTLHVVDSLKKKLLKVYQKIHKQDNVIRKRYLLFHWHDYVIHYSEVYKPNYSWFTFNLNPLFIIQLSPQFIHIF